MDNRIRQINVWDARLDPAEAEVVIGVYPEHLTSTTQVRGRLMGPTNLYASTVEVAYPLREQSREYETTGTPRLTMRVIIPEGNFWEPQTPFLYHGPVELWQGGKCCDRVQVTRGLRDIRLGPRGLRVNGRPFTIRGAALDSCSEEEAHRLRRAGLNTLLAPASPGAVGLWDLADRYGFLMLGRLANWREFSDTLRALARHPSGLGWLLAPEFFQHPILAQAPDLATALLPAYNLAEKPVVGVELPEPSAAGRLPPGVFFIACREELLPDLGEIALPKIILGKLGAEPAAAPPGALGWVEPRP
jgi:hypothetical protein